QRLEDLVADAVAHRLGGLALHAAAHFLAQAVDAGITQTEGAREFVIDRRQHLLLDRLHGEVELRLLARQLPGAVVIGELHRRGLVLALRHADERILEVGDGAAGADHHGHAGAAAALEFLAIDAADEINQHTVVLLRGALHGIEGGTLATHALEHGVDVLFADVEHRPLDLERGHRIDHHLGHHLDHGGEFQVLARPDLDGLDARAAGRAQLLFRHRIAVTLADQLGHRIAMHLAAELLLDDAEGDLALAETADVRGARQVAQAAIDFAGNAGAGHLHFDATLKALGGLYGELHGLPESAVW